MKKKVLCFGELLLRLNPPDHRRFAQADTFDIQFAGGKGDNQAVRKDFCGWSALGPISLFIESIIGFHSINAFTNEVHWNLHHKFRHGIKRLKFSNVITDIIAENNRVEVKSNAPFTLIINDKKYTIKTGEQIFDLLKMTPIN